MITAGVDIGSLTGKTVILEDNEIIAWSLVPTTYDSAETAVFSVNEALNKAKLSLKDIDYVVSTGYGRVVVPFANKNVTEISCHAKGATWLDPGVRTILDMGGQDCKAIRCEPGGNVTNFVMNDKCAAGVGRYLEIIAQILEIPLEQIGEVSLKYEGNPMTISSTCTVFARSEVLRSIRQGANKNNVLAGAHDALVTRAYGLLSRVGIEKELMITGGIAKNIGIVKRLEQRVGFVVKTSFEPQIVGAMGAALFAGEFAKQEMGVEANSAKCNR